MTDQERREKEIKRLTAFGVALGGDEAWERKFRESTEVTTTMVKMTSPRVSVTPPGINVSLGVGSKQRGDQGRVDPLEQVSNRTLEQKRRRERGNGPEPEQAPLRASRSFSLSGRPEKPKSTAREKDSEALRRFFKAEVSLEEGLKPLSDYLKWFPPRYDREAVAVAYGEVKGT